MSLDFVDRALGSVGADLRKLTPSTEHFVPTRRDFVADGGFSSTQRSSASQANITRMIRVATADAEPGLSFSKKHAASSSEAGAAGGSGRAGFAGAGFGGSGFGGGGFGGGSSGRSGDASTSAGAYAGGEATAAENDLTFDSDGLLSGSFPSFAAAGASSTGGASGGGNSLIPGGPSSTAPGGGASHAGGVVPPSTSGTPSGVFPAPPAVNAPSTGGPFAPPTALLPTGVVETALPVDAGGALAEQASNPAAVTGQADMIPNPEPASLATLGSGLLLLVSRVRRRRAARNAKD